MSCRAIGCVALAQIDLCNEHRRKRLEAREPHKHAVERARHALRPHALPGIGGKRRFDQSRHRSRLDAFTRYIAQNHDHAIVGKTDKRIEISAHQRLLGCRGIQAVRGDPRYGSKRAPHSRLKGLCDAMLRFLLARALNVHLKIMRQMHQVIVLKVVNWLLRGAA